MDELKLSRATVSDQIFEYMKDAIARGIWAVDEKIPSEAELAEKFGVNRLTVRVSLQQLLGMGVLEKRVGDGTYVKAFDFGSYLQKISDLYMRPELLDQVSEFRRTIELECARLASLRGTEEEFETLHRLADEYRQLMRAPGEKTDADFDAIVTKDVEFHRQICVMSKNDLFLNAYDMAKEAISRYLHVIVRKRVQDWRENNVDVSQWNDLHHDIHLNLMKQNTRGWKKAYLDMIDRETTLK